MSGQQWHPMPCDLIADFTTHQWTTANQAPKGVGYLWTWRQMEDGHAPSIRDLARYAGWTRWKAQQVRARVLDDRKTWEAFGSLTKLNRTATRQPPDTYRTVETDKTEVIEAPPDSNQTATRQPPDTHARDPSKGKLLKATDHAVELPGKPHTESTPPEIDHVVTLCELYREHSHRLTRTGRRGRIGDSPGLRRMWGSALEVAEDHGYDAETLIAMFELVFTTKRGEFWQRGGKGNQEIVSGSGLVTYLLRCKGSTYGTGQPTREKLVQRLAEAQEYLDDSAAVEQMRAAHMVNAGPSGPPRALQVAPECQDIGEGTEASTEALRAFSGRGGK